jgi:hypothetical protein
MEGWDREESNQGYPAKGIDSKAVQPESSREGMGGKNSVSWNEMARVENTNA